MSDSTLTPQVVAHRGNAAEFPENTLPALRSALELGAPFVEFDVHLTADLVPIIAHDANLKRTAGLERNVFDLRWDELAAITVGEPTRFGSRFTDVGIPTLAQAVELLSQFPQATAFVELKRTSLRKFGAEMVAHRICEALQPIATQAVIISFDQPVLEYIQHSSAYRIGWVISEYSAATAKKAALTAPHYLFCDQDILPQNTAPLWQGCWQWVIYEIKTHIEALALSQRGVTLIETMEVRKLLHALTLAHPA